MSYYDIINYLDRRKRQEEQNIDQIYKKIKVNILESIKKKQNRCIFNMTNVLFSNPNPQKTIYELITRLKHDGFTAEQSTNYIIITWSELSIKKEKSKLKFDNSSTATETNTTDSNTYISDDESFIEKIARLKNK